MNISVIGDNDTLAGFALTGIKDLYPVDNSEDAWEAYQEISNEIVIIPEKFIKIIEKNRIDQKLLVKLSLEGKSNLDSLIKNALGFDIKLGENNGNNN